MLRLTLAPLFLIFFQITVQEVIPDGKDDKLLFPPDEKAASSLVEDAYSNYESIFNKMATTNELYSPDKRYDALTKFCEEDGMNKNIMPYHTVAKETNGKVAKDLVNNRIKRNEELYNNYKNDILILQPFHFRTHKLTSRLKNICNRLKHSSSPASDNNTDNYISDHLGSHTDIIAYGPSQWQNSTMSNYRYKRSVNRNETKTGATKHNSDMKNKEETIDNSSETAFEDIKIRRIGFSSGYRRYPYGIIGNRYRPANHKPTIIVMATLNGNNRFPINNNNAESKTNNNGNNNSFKPSSNAQCNPNSNLYYPNSEDCSTYFTCNHGVMVLTHCPRGHYYISERSRCEDSIPEGCKHVVHHIGQYKPIHED